MGPASPVVGVALMLATGFPVAFALTRRLLLAVLFAPVVSGLTATFAVILMLVIGGDLRIWLVALLVVQYAAAWVWRRRAAPLPYATWVDVLWLVVPLLLPFLLVLSPPIEWDAHAIWWTHAAYFTHGAAYARQAIGSPAFAFSHPDYPPLESAQVAAVWSVLPGDNLYLAQFASATLTFGVIGALGYAVRQATAQAPTLVSRLAAILVSLAVWSTAGWAVASGMSDPLWAAAFVAATVLLLVGDQPAVRPAIPAVLLTAVALAKNEAFIAVVLLAVLTAIRYRRQPRRIWPVAPAVLAGVAWILLAHSLGAQSDLAAQSHLGGLLTGDRAVYARLPPTLAALGVHVGLIGGSALVAAVLGGIFLGRGRRRALGLGSDLWVWAVAVAYTLSLIVTYLASYPDIHWYLATSAERVTLPIALLACVSAAAWVVTAIGPARRTAAGPAAEPATGPAAEPEGPTTRADDPAAGSDPADAPTAAAERENSATVPPEVDLAARPEPASGRSRGR